jgi:hypothetical protein
MDQDAAQAHLTHLAERDLERPAVCVWRRTERGMPPSKRGAGESQIVNG